MRFVCLAGLAAALMACGPTVSVSSGTEGDSGSDDGGDTTGGVGTTEPSSTGSSGVTSNDVDTNDDDSWGGSSTGEPADPQWCWTSEWTDATGIGEVWTDGTSILAAAGTSVVTFDGDAWQQLPLEGALPEARQVAASSAADAWFGGVGDSLAHYEAGVFSAVDLPLEDADLISLELDASGTPWVLLRPDSGCGIGPCKRLDARLYRRDGGEWVEQDASGWVNQIDIVGDTMWAIGQEGQVAWSSPGGPWTFVESETDASLNGLLAVSATEFWITQGGQYWHWVDGAWTYGSLGSLQIRGTAVDEAGGAWWITKDFSEDTARLQRMDDDGLTMIAEVPDAFGVSLTIQGGDALLGGFFGGNRLYRVTDLEGAATLSTPYDQDDIGNFEEMFVPRVGEVIGRVGVSFNFGGAEGLQVHRSGAWSQVEATLGHVRSVWGLDANGFWAVGSQGTLGLWWVDDGVPTIVELPLEAPQLAGVWGTSNEDVYICGAPSAEGAGVVNRLLVMHWDGQAWTDISPEGVNNIGGPSFLDIHGVGEDVFVRVDLRVHHFDGTSWDSTLSTLDTSLRSLRAYAPDELFVVDENGVLLVLDGNIWRLAADTWPELTGLEGRKQLTGSADAGIYLSVYADEEDEDGQDALWVYRGEGWEPFELPEGLGRGAVIGVAEDGGEIWADDGRRIWTGTDCG